MNGWWRELSKVQILTHIKFLKSIKEMKSCKDCSSRVVWDSRYGKMDKCKFVICGFKPNLRMKPKTIPKWCPRIDEFEENIKNETN